MSKKRFCNDVVVCFVTTVSLFLTTTLTNGFAVQILDDIPMELNSFNFRSDMPNYTDYVDNHTYISGNVVFDPNAMAGFYRLTQNFMNSVLDPNFLKEDQVQWKQSGNGSSLVLSSISNLPKNYWVLVFIVVLIALITLLIPIIGLVFCCCRCCGNCGAKSEPRSNKENGKKIVEGAVLIVLGTILLMAVVCAFTTNQQMHTGTSEFPKNVRKTYSDASAYLSSLTDQANNLLKRNYKEFSTVFKDSLLNSGANVLKKTKSWQNASAMLYLNDFVVAMPDIQRNLQKLKNNTDELKRKTDEVNKGLTDVKADLMSTLSKCSTIIKCKETEEQISSIKFNIDINQIPDVSLAINQLARLNITALQNAAEAGKTKLDYLENNINSTLGTNIEAACQQIDSAGTTIEENMDNMLQVIRDLREEINNANSTLENAYDYIAKYSPYFYYVGLILSCILLLIPVCITLGLLGGVCGKTSQKHKRSTCSKDTGSLFLISGVLLIFIFTIFLGVLTCVMMIFGFAVDRLICYPLRHPEQSTVINIIDTYIAKNNYVDFNVSINEILVRCSNDESLYKVFSLSSKFNLSKIEAKFDVNGTVRDIIENITKEAKNLINPESFSILSSEDFTTLKELAGINPDVNVIGFEQNQFNQNLLKANLQPVKQSLEEISNITGIPDAVRSNIVINIDQIEQNEKSLQEISRTANETLVLAKTLDQELKMNHSDFSEAINVFLADVTAAQEQLKHDSTEIIDAAGDFGIFVSNQATGYLRRVINVLKNDLGRCRPLNVAINSALVATCDQIFMPWNGFWVALFISLLVFVPTLIVSIALASLYKKYKFTGQSFKADKLLVGKHQNVPYPKGGRHPPKSRYDDMAPRFNSNLENQTSTRF